MKQTDIAVVGGGPAGLCAAIVAASAGCRVTLIDDNSRLGGQLIKQTHKFFGSKAHYCGVRGIDIAKILEGKVYETGVEVLLDTTVIGLYDQNIIGLANQSAFDKLKYQALIVATGATENTLLFENNDLPGIYGAGAVQTLMNVYGIRPGRRILMVGSGNIGLIVSYQLLQAGMEVDAVIEALPTVGGYHVHAAKLARLGVPILTQHTISAAIGRRCVTGAEICRVNTRFQPIRGTTRRLKVDTICLAVGLTPASELLRMAGCRMVWVPELGGHVAWHDDNMQTSLPKVYVCGDASGIEEASTAMLEGRIAGAHAAMLLAGETARLAGVISDAQAELKAIRQGPFGEKTACGKTQLRSLGKTWRDDR